MSSRTMKDAGEGRLPTTPENSRYGTGFDFLGVQDLSRATVDLENSNPSLSTSALKASPLQTWIHEYDNGKVAAGRGTPSVASAFARLTYTPAATPASSPETLQETCLLNISKPEVEEGYSPKQSQESPTPISRHRPLLSRRETLQASSSISSYAFPDPASPYKTSKDELSPSNSKESSRAPASPQDAPLAKTVEPRSSSKQSLTAGRMLQVMWESEPPVNTWESHSLTRHWTQDQVRIALLRIMSELNFDFYEDYYLLLDFDGSQQIVRRLWAVIGIVYTEFLRSHVYGLDILTLIAMNENALNGGPLANINAVLADMICFFAAGKIGMEKRAENMAQALISGGDIITFVSRRCAENGLEYPGGIGRTEMRIVQACMHDALLRGGW